MSDDIPPRPWRQTLRRPLAAVLFVGLALLVGRLFGGAPSEVTVRFRLPAGLAREARALDLRYIDAAGELLVKAHFNHPAGVPAETDHAVRLPKGRHQVEVLLEREGRTLLDQKRGLLVEGGGDRPMVDFGN